MPAPSTSLATLRPDLAGGLTEFDLAADREGFIATQLFPIFNVGRKSGKFGRIPLEQLLQKRDTNRKSRGGYSRGDWTFTDDSYVCAEHGAEEPIDEDEAEIYADYFDVEAVSTERAYDAVLRNQELRACALATDAAVWTGATLTAAAAVKWNLYATAKPIEDVENAVRKVWANSGVWPNAIVIDRLAFRDLRNCAQIIDRIAAQGAGSATKPSDITAAMLASVVDLEKVIVQGGAQNTADAGQAAAISTIWPTAKAMVCRVATRADLRQPCLGRIMRYKPSDVAGLAAIVESYRDEAIRSDVIRVRHDVQEKLLYTEMGFLITDCV